MQVRHKIELLVGDDEHTYFARDGDTEVAADGFTAAEAGTMILPGSQDPRVLPMGDVAEGQGVFVEVDGPTTLSVGDTATLALAPPPNGGTTARILFEGAVGSLSAKAATPGRPVRGRYVVWGESAGDPDAG